MLQTIEILDTNAEWTVINKPAGLSVHNADSHSTNQDVLSLLKSQLKLKEAPLPIHRLDADTSGVLWLAHSPQIAQQITAQWQDAKKIYSAILKGILSEPIKWSYALTDKAEGFKNPAGSGPKKQAETLMTPIRNNQYFTLIKAEILTGRTHQIRRHAALAKHPIIGDTRYGNRKYNQKIQEIYGVNRLYLHCETIELTLNGKSVRFHAPNNFLLF